MTTSKLTMHCAWDNSCPRMIYISKLLPDMGFCCMKCLSEYAHASEMPQSQFRRILRKLVRVPNESDKTMVE